MDPKVLCSECDTEVERNNSERGRGWFCPQCKELKYNNDIQRHFPECACCDGEIDNSEEAKERRIELAKKNVDDVDIDDSDNLGEYLLDYYTTRTEKLEQPAEMMCKDCIKAGCNNLIRGCSYRKSTTDPSECEHSFFNRAFEDGIECRWCGYVTSGGPKSHDYGETWGEQRLSRLQEDKYQCAICEISQQKHRMENETGLHVHHIVPYRKFDDDEEAHDLQNLVTLCVDCHKSMEPRTPEEQKEILGR